MDKIVITTGGTGGHIFPALAVAEELKKRFPRISILFIGGNYGLEKSLVEKAGISFKGLPVRGILGKGFRSLSAISGMAKSVKEAVKLLRDYNPEIIAGFGGYASFPALLAGRILNIPRMVHEQNAIAGASNKISSYLGAKVCMGAPETKGFPGKGIFTGNPVRSDLKNNPVKTFGRTKRLLVMGGSQGAHALNAFMVKILDVLAESEVDILHQCGPKDLAELKKAYRDHSYSENSVQAFIEDMSHAYAWADLVLCRAGASSIAEICVTGTPAIFVPFPAAIHDHQTFNARIVEKAGGACVVPETELDLRKTASLIIGLLKNPGKLENMSKSLLKIAQPEAAKKIVDLLVSLSRKRHRNEA